jgi:hypothetical protein
LLRTEAGDAAGEQIERQDLGRVVHHGRIGICGAAALAGSSTSARPP